MKGLDGVLLDCVAGEEEEESYCCDWFGVSGDILWWRLERLTDCGREQDLDLSACEKELPHDLDISIDAYQGLQRRERVDGCRMRSLLTSPHRPSNAHTLTNLCTLMQTLAP